MYNPNGLNEKMGSYIEYYTPLKRAKNKLIALYHSLHPSVGMLSCIQNVAKYIVPRTSPINVLDRIHGKLPDISICGCAIEYDLQQPERLKGAGKAVAECAGSAA